MSEMQSIPADYSLERAVLGQLFLEPQLIKKVIESPAELFQEPRYSLVAKVMEHLWEHDGRFDQLTVTARLREMGAQDTVDPLEIARIDGEIHSTGNFDSHIAVLKAHAHQRSLLMAGKTLVHNAVRPDSDPAELLEAHSSAIREIRKSLGGRKLTLAEQVRDWVLATDGVFLTNDVHQELNLATRGEKQNCNKALQNLTAEGLIERTGAKRGQYRRIDCTSELIAWEEASTEKLDISWPFGLEEYVDIMPGNIIVAAGKQNAGKTAFLLNFVRLNMTRHEIFYYSSEMGASEMRRRLEKFGLPLSEWRFYARERSYDFHDVIHPDAINIIDFLEIHDEFWKVGAHLKRIHDKLGRGIAVVALQKNPDTNVGRGGNMGLEKPRLYLSLSPGLCTIVKGKNWARGDVNPNGMEFNFKLVQGARFI